jgi:tyrosine-protein phosphatase YwqE
MFFFKKNKSYLCDLIPSDYIDIHSHLLPSIDDGSKSIQETIELINDLKKIGFSEFITTPHVMNYVWKNSKDSILNNFETTSKKLIENNININFNVAAEYMMDENLSQLIINEKLLPIKENFVLIEMSYLNPPINLYEMLFDLQVAGYKPILAHPERYSFYHASLNEYTKLKNAGCYFQMNLLSSVGYYGVEVAKTVDYLLKQDLIDFAGSDVHHSKHVDSFKNKIVLKNSSLLKSVFQNNLQFKS